MDTLSTERLKEIAAGCEGVTPGPWFVGDGANSHVFDLRIIPQNPAEEGIAFSGGANAAHIARCDPATILSMATELLALREAIKPFASCVFNDNGDMTVSAGLAKHEDFVRAYFAARRAALTPASA